MKSVTCTGMYKDNDDLMFDMEILTKGICPATREYNAKEKESKNLPSKFSLFVQIVSS